METPSCSSPEQTIQAYVDACRAGDIDSLRGIFLPGATMSGIFEGEFYLGSPEIFFDEVRDNPLSPEAQREFRATIESSEIFHDIASIVLRETGYLGSYNLTNLFHLVERPVGWRITGKVYSDGLQP